MIDKDKELKRVFAYTRVSQMNEGKLSTQMQIAEIRRFCEYNGYEILNVYSDEDLSGSETSHRTSFNRMFDDIEKKTFGDIDLVICYNLSRFSRSIKDINIYTHILKNDLNCGFRSVQESFIDTSSSMGTFLLNIFAAIAQLERDRLIDVISDSNVNRAKTGGRWTNGGVVPYGYKKEGNTIVPEEGSAELVKQIFKWYVEEDLMLKSIAVKLQRSNIPNKRNDVDVSVYRKDKRLNDLDLPVMWNASKIGRILENPAYMGVNVTNRREKTKSVNSFNTHKKKSEYEWVWSNNFRINRLDLDMFWESEFEILQHDFEPLVDIETFIKAQKKRAQYNRYEPHREHTDYLLQGKLYCGKCGRRFNGKKNTRDAKKTYYYYVCNTKFGKTADVCDMETIRCDFIEDFVIAALADKIIMSRVVSIVENLERDKTQIDAEYQKKDAEIKKEIADCELAINNLFSFIRTATVLTEEITTRMQTDLNDLQQRKAELEKTAKELKTEYLLNRDTSDVDRVKLLEKWLNNDFTDLSFDTMKAILDEWVERVVYYSKDHIDIYLKFDRDNNKFNYDEPFEKIIEQRMKNLKRQRHRNDFVKMVKEVIKDGVASIRNGLFLGLSGIWQYENASLWVHIHTTTSQRYVLVITNYEPKDKENYEKLP